MLLNYLELLTMVVILLGLFFVISMQPMFMISVLIMIICMYSYILYLVMGGYWFGYALMMVMLSGVLVLFTYMVSLMPNESFESYNLVYMMGFIMLLGGSCYIWKFGYKYSFISLNLWGSVFSYMNIYMISFLLSIMLMVVWLSYLGQGALRVI